MMWVLLGTRRVVTRRTSSIWLAFYGTRNKYIRSCSLHVENSCNMRSSFNVEIGKNVPRLKKGTLKICGELPILLHEWRPPNQEEIPDILLSDASAEVRSIVLTPAISSSLQTTDRTEPICLTFYQQIDKESKSLEESKLSFLAHKNTFKDVFVLLFEQPVSQNDNDESRSWGSVSKDGWETDWRL